jgi:hypothetical protein
MAVTRRDSGRGGSGSTGKDDFFGRTAHRLPKWRWRTAAARRDTAGMQDVVDWLHDNWLLLVLGLGLLAFVIVTTYAISLQGGRRQRG